MKLMKNSLKILIFMFVILFNIENMKAENSNIITGTSYTLPKAIVDKLLDLKVNRGYGMDRQDLGIYMPAGSSFKIRVTGDINLNIDLLNDGTSTETTYTVTNEWTTITTDSDSVPFIKTSHSDFVSEINYEICDLNGTENLTIYKRGDNQNNFINSWDDNSQNFAVISDDYITILIPRSDITYLRNIINNQSTAEYPFTSIDNMLDWYDGVITRYNSYIGLSKNATKDFNTDVHMKFFLKADKNANDGREPDEPKCALAYKLWNYVYTCSSSIDSLLKKGWAAVHEIGHGFQSYYTWSPSENDLLLSEVENNFFAYEEEKKYSNNSDGPIGILYTTHNNIVHDQSYYMNIINGVSTFNELLGDRTNSATNAEARLFIFENLFDKIGMTNVMPETLKAYRAYKNMNRQISNADLFALYFSETSNYNVIPYFNFNKIQVSNVYEQAVYANKYKIVYPLAFVFNDDSATNIANDLNLRGIYSVVENNQIKNYASSNNINRDVTFNITTENQQKLLHKKLYIKNSIDDIVKEVVLDGSTVTVEDVPVGMYYVSIANGTIDNLNYLIVSEENNQITENLNYNLTENDESDSSFNDISGTGGNDSNNPQSSTNTESQSNNSTGNNTTVDNNTSDVKNEDDNLIVNINYEYDPKNVDDKGETIEVPDTGISRNIYVGIGMIFISFGIALFIYKRKELLRY